MGLPTTILVPVELDHQTEPVIDYAVALAGKLDARIHLLHALSPPLLGSEVSVAVTETTLEDIAERSRQQLDQLAAARVDQAAFGPSVLRIGEARGVIDEVAEELGADLIVMGTHGRSGISRFVLGSIAESVARTARCPVLLVRAGAHERPVLRRAAGVR